MTPAFPTLLTRLRACIFFGLLAYMTGLFFCALSLPTHAAAQKTLASNDRVSDGLSLIRKGIAGNLCTFTFDDGPSPYTEQLLDILKEYNILATFFVVGSQARYYPDTIRRIIAEGHEVGNHSFSHGPLRKRSPKSQADDLRALDAALRELGANPRFIRPPYGSYDSNTLDIVEELDGHIVLWSVDSHDWRKKSDSGGILSTMEPVYSDAPLRGVFLFHDIHKTTVERMPEIIQALRAQGCNFIGLTEYIDTPLEMLRFKYTKPLRAALFPGLRKDGNQTISHISTSIFGPAWLIPAAYNARP